MAPSRDSDSSTGVPSKFQSTVMAIPRPQVHSILPSRQHCAHKATQAYRVIHSSLHPAVAGQSILLGALAWQHHSPWPTLPARKQSLTTDTNMPPSQQPPPSFLPPASVNRTRPYSDNSPSSSSTPSSSSPPTPPPTSSKSAETPSPSPEPSEPPLTWEDDANYNISAFSELPHRHFGFNQHMLVNAEFKEALRQVLWQFRAPIRYAFAYGSGVFPQSKQQSENPSSRSPHPRAPEAVTKWQSSPSGSGSPKNIDFIFGVSYTQHWHSLNLSQHRDHYSFLGSLGSGVVKRVQDGWGAGAYFNPYVTLNGLSIKYGVVNLDTLHRDLSEWDTLYLAGRLQKPIKILRDDPRIRLANQVNLISALRTALLMLPPTFTERDLYFKIAGLSYIGDLRMAFNAERPDKVYSIVDSQMPSFRQLYFPLIADLPNVAFADPRHNSPGAWMHDPDLNAALAQSTDPVRRGNMVRRLPRAFRHRLYAAYRGVFGVPAAEYESLLREGREEDAFSRRVGGEFDRRIAGAEGVERMVRGVVQKTVMWPTVSQSFKGLLTAGPTKSWRYLMEKREKGRQRRVSEKPRDAAPAPPAGGGANEQGEKRAQQRE